MLLTHKCNSKVVKNVKTEKKVRIHTNFFLNMLHSLIIQVKVSSVNKAEMRKCLIYKCHLLFGLLIDLI